MNRRNSSALQQGKCRLGFKENFTTEQRETDTGDSTGASGTFLTSAGQKGLRSAVLLTGHESGGLPKVFWLCCYLALCFCGVKLENTH